MSQRSLHQGWLPAASNRSFHSEDAMKVLPSRTKSAANQASFVLGIALAAAVLTVSTVADFATRSSLANAGPEARVGTLALKWFAEMHTGEIDRTRLTADYSSQLTDAAVQGMSRYLKDHDYGVPPLRAEVVTTRTIGSQTFYEVKLVFRRGDAASLLFGFNPEGKITGVSLLSMAGD
jgi:hypothetical protein